ncbi:MAG: hypothetical protein RMM06_09645, partial [Armatimonadota bacterium]|nr:hypothetical protein [Armatimonadota bacterium]
KAVEAAVKFIQENATKVEERTAVEQAATISTISTSARLLSMLLRRLAKTAQSLSSSIGRTCLCFAPIEKRGYEVKTKTLLKQVSEIREGGSLLPIAPASVGGN